MRRTFNRGISMIEMIVVIAIVAIIGSMVAVFLRAPLQSYVAQDRRAGLADAADTALRRMGRDLRLALPNSVRVDEVGGVFYLEYLGTHSGGRYRAQGDGSVGNDHLDFTGADDDGDGYSDSSFDVLGPAIAMQPGDLIAVYNLGIPGADAWAGDTLVAYTGTGGNVTNIAIAPKPSPFPPFPLASPGNRFQVVEGPVSYVCDPTAGTLTRYWGYTATPGQMTSFAAATPRALLAQRVSACRFAYQSGVTERSGLVSVTLSLTEENESVRLYAATQVSNQP